MAGKKTGCCRGLTLGTRFSGRCCCREVAVVKRFKQEAMYELSAGTKKEGVVERWPGLVFC